MDSPQRKTILHVCRRDMLRPLRDQILRLSGYEVDSFMSVDEGRSSFWQKQYDLVLIDVEGERGVPEAEALCAELRAAQPEQLIAFVCNWRVAMMTDCPDEILRMEFDPASFVEGVKEIVKPE
ncbi:response regulator transcription factor [Terriglobus albidus]|uniref:Response regulator transcription factor n=2 Tax=Terriglobus albidus TaxID=1592106 RepID=A0A5B9ECB2_9BACT|nr:response regulator transcription factor [Terriglobus albidus]